MTTIEILKSARERISHPNGWTKGSYARSALGRTIGADSPGAVCWCAIGAVRASGATADEDDRAIHELDETLFVIGEGGKGGGFVPAFNDDHSHDEVLALFDRTIERLEKGKS